jgi:hypothetical protein
MVRTSVSGKSRSHRGDKLPHCGFQAVRGNRCPHDGVQAALGWELAGRYHGRNRGGDHLPPWHEVIGVVGDTRAASVRDGPAGSVCGAGVDSDGCGALWRDDLLGIAADAGDWRPAGFRSTAKDSAENGASRRLGADWSRSSKTRVSKQGWPTAPEVVDRARPCHTTLF